VRFLPPEQDITWKITKGPRYRERINRRFLAQDRPRNGVTLNDQTSDPKAGVTEDRLLRAMGGRTVTHLPIRLFLLAHRRAATAGSKPNTGLVEAVTTKPDVDQALRVALRSKDESRVSYGDRNPLCGAMFSPTLTQQSGSL
jgi:hypothetical protein